MPISLSMHKNNPDCLTIALIEYNWCGHHSVWFKLYTKVLVEHGYDVVGFCPAPEEMEQWAGEALGADNKKSCEFIYRGIRKLPHWIPVRLRQRVSSAVQYLSLAWVLKRWQRQAGKRIDLVFFTCIYDYNFEYFNDVAHFFGFPVSGLYLHCRSIRMPGSPIPQSGRLPCLEKFWGRKPFCSLAVLDEGAQAEVEKLGKGLPVVWMPDVTTANLPKVNGHGIAAKLSRYALGEPILLLAGQIQPTKGAELFCDVADIMREDKICFAIVGDVAWGAFSAISRDKLRRVAEQSRNVFAHFARVPDEADINACIAASDVIFAAYQSFPNSSNILSKAAQFGKPIIVSDGYLMAERVRKFRLGVVIPEGDTEGAVNAVREIISDPAGWCRVTKPDWEGSLAEHSEKKLSEAFAELVNKSLKCSSSSRA